MNTPVQLTSRGYILDLDESSFGELNSSQYRLGENMETLREQFAEQGYLLLRNLLPEEKVLAARSEVIDRLNHEGLLDESQPLQDGVLKSGITSSGNTHRLSKDNRPLMDLLYQGELMDFYGAFLNGPVLHFDYTWFRCTCPGQGTPPHCDIVYMGRGTPNLYTTWTPIGDIDLSLGGLIILEKSHLQTERLRSYLSKDVDSYCKNRKEGKEIEAGTRKISQKGQLTSNPVSLREKLGGRWLTTHFHPGDALIFGMTTIHGSLDNQTNRVRLSSDSRYQLATEAADERWIGPNPMGHGGASVRGMIC